MYVLDLDNIDFKGCKRFYHKFLYLDDKLNIIKIDKYYDDSAYLVNNYYIDKIIEKFLNLIKNNVFEGIYFFNVDKNERVIIKKTITNKKVKDGYIDLTKCDSYPNRIEIEKI